MSRNLAHVLYVVLMVAVIVSLDFLFFRHRFRARLIANIAIVLVALTFYFIVLNRK